MAKEPSICWDLFIKSSDGISATCKVCQVQLKFFGSTTGINNHLRSYHKAEIAASESRRESRKSNSGSTGTLSVQKDLDALLLTLVCSSGVPFEFANSPHFREFCSQMNDKYTVPSADKLRRRLTSSTDSFISQQITVLKEMERGWLSLDSWEAPFHKGHVYGFYLFFIGKDGKRKEVFLGVHASDVGSTAVDVGEITLTTLQKFKVDLSSVLGSVSDAGSNLKAFLHRNNLWHIHCSAHSISLIIQKAAQVSTMASVYHKINGLAALLSRSRSEREKLRERSRNLKIHHRLPVPFCITRFGGFFLLAQSFMEHYQSLNVSSSFQKFLLTDSEQTTVKLFIQLIEPFFCELTTAESNNSFVSQILPSFAFLNRYSSQFPQQSSIVRVVARCTKTNYEDLIRNDIVIMCTLLDPRYAYHSRIADEIIWDRAESLIEEYCESLKMEPIPAQQTGEPNRKKRKPSEIPSLREFLEEGQAEEDGNPAKVEIIAFKAKVTRKRLPEDSSPMEFWIGNRSEFPLLSQAAYHLLSAPKSACQVERLFSRCKSLMGQSRRNRMKVDTLNAILMNTALANLSLAKTADLDDELICDDSEFQWSS